LLVYYLLLVNLLVGGEKSRESQTPQSCPGCHMHACHCSRSNTSNTKACSPRNAPVIVCEPKRRRSVLMPFAFNARWRLLFALVSGHTTWTKAAVPRLINTLQQCERRHRDLPGHFGCMAWSTAACQPACVSWLGHMFSHYVGMPGDCPLR